MPGKPHVSKKKSQQLKRNSKRKTDDDEELSEKKVRNTGKRNKSHSNHLSSEGQTKHTNIKQIKIAPNKRKTWQPLSKSSREHLQTIMESVIIRILSSQEKEEIQYHLNLPKKRLLQLCETLKVPPEKLKDLTHVSSLLDVERAREQANKEGLALLQEEIEKMVETAELMTEDFQSLKNKIEILEREVEEKKKTLKQVLQMDISSVLSLPELSQKRLKAPTLQKEILTQFQTRMLF
ncbi:centromere protein Q-like [Nycticebus coucang]|uniref:centromere protein Q-like n=1 Tax=Nycticebus coucang TaxID=9470 RepID=UPI00234C4CBA|nr:centromere protein Q-like [Nycticebus coucang]